MARFCERCGKPMGDNANFCSVCGSPISAISADTERDWDAEYVEDRGLYEKFFTHKGRLNRKRYALRLLCLFAVTVFVQLFTVMAVSGGCGLDNVERFYLEAGDYIGMGSIVINFICFVFLNVSEIMITIRRLHDLDHTGWWTLLTYIPFVNAAFGIYLLFAQGNRGPNIYGPDPLNYRRDM